MSPRIAAVILAPTAVDPLALRALAMRTCLTTVERVCVVLGFDLSPALHGLPVHVETAPSPAAALRVALPWALRSGCEGLLLLSADAPCGSGDLERLLAGFRAGQTTLVGPLAMPAVVHRAEFGRLVASAESLVAPPLAPSLAIAA